MKNKRISRIVLYYLAFFAGLTVIWIAVFYSLILPKDFVKTQATVISVRKEGALSPGNGGITTYFPTYTYKDDKGATRVFMSRDGYNWINGVLFKKKTGDTVTAYYEKGSKEGLWITGTGDWYTFLLAPMVFAVFPIGVLFAIVLIATRKKSIR